MLEAVIFLRNELGWLLYSLVAMSYMKLVDVTESMQMLGGFPPSSAAFKASANEGGNILNFPWKHFTNNWIISVSPYVAGYVFIIAGWNTEAWVFMHSPFFSLFSMPNVFQTLCQSLGL